MCLFITISKHLYHTLRLQLLEQFARVVVMHVYTSITEMVSRLHWLPVWSRIHFKINLITFMAIAHQHPPSLWNILEVGDVPQGLRSARATCLDRPYAGGFGTHAFANYAPKLWNALPVGVRCAGSVPAFRKALKTHYFNHPSLPTP